MTKRVFRVFTMQRYNIAKAHFGLPWASLRKSWEKVVSVDFGGFCWVSAFIIYIYYICVQIECVLSFCKMIIYKTNIVPPLGRELYIIYIYK